MSSCSGNCSSCGSSECGDRKAESLLAKLNPRSTVKKVIAVVSGKGGVGKSLVTSLLAVLTRRRGHKTAILDADITGPSIPGVFGVHQKAEGNEMGVFPATTESGIELMSINLLLENENDPVVWRGPVIAGAVKQFWTDVVWKDLDLLFIDMPPGTGDVPLTVFQSIPIAGIVIVSTPQDLVKMVVEKAVNMANMMQVPVLGLVENMSYLNCPDCGKKIDVFGASKADAMAREYNIPAVARMPLDPQISALADAGRIEDYDGAALADVFAQIEKAKAR